MSRLFLYAVASLLLLAPGLNCSKEKETETDIYSTLQGGSRGRWENRKISEDKDGKRLEITTVVVFKLPNSYRWYVTGTRGGMVDSTLAYAEEGTFEVTGDQITFMPQGGEPWTVQFEIVASTGNLVITKEEGDVITFEFRQSGDFW